jgi:hypothetical protein
MPSGGLGCSGEATLARESDVKPPAGSQLPAVVLDIDIATVLLHPAAELTLLSVDWRLAIQVIRSD